MFITVWHERRNKMPIIRTFISPVEAVKTAKLHNGKVLDLHSHKVIYGKESFKTPFD